MHHADSAKITGAAVIDRDGEKVGTATDIIFDDIDLQPRWVVVRYGTLRHHHTAVPFDRLYVADGGEVVVEPDREAVMQAPRVGRGAPLSPDEETSLESYFHTGRS